MSCFTWALIIFGASFAIAMLCAFVAAWAEYDTQKALQQILDELRYGRKS